MLLKVPEDIANLKNTEFSRTIGDLGVFFIL